MRRLNRTFYPCKKSLCNFCFQPQYDFRMKKTTIGLLVGSAMLLLLVSSFSPLTFGQSSNLAKGGAIPSAISFGNTGHRVLVVPLQYPTIQSAINAAKRGDTIKVLPGAYTEQLFINKSITLLGSGAASTTINVPKKIVGDSAPTAGGPNYWGVHIARSAHVTISGFTFATPTKSFLPCTLSNNAANCATIGVDGGANLELSSSVVYFSFLTVGLWVGLGDTPSSVPFSTGHAIVNSVDFELPPTATKNLSISYAGIWTGGDSTLQISYSRIVTIPTFGGETDGIFLDTGTTASISYNTIVGANPIVTYPNVRAEISYNTIMPTGISAFTGSDAGATEAAVSISQGSKVEVSYNTIIGAPNVFYGIIVYASNSTSNPTVATISSNTISNFICTNTVGRPAGWCGANPLKFQNQLIGIYVVPQFFTCGCGPYPQTTPNQISITNNFIYHSDVGISLQAVQNCCVVSGNVISKSTDYGIQAYEGRYTFSDNIIIGGKYGINAVGGFFSLIGRPSADATIISVNNVIQGVTIARVYLLAVSPYTAKVVFKK
jgi:hypothetical protein